MVHGDPMTPLLEGYRWDNVKLRVIRGSQEEQHLFQVHGLRWREEPDNPGVTTGQRADHRHLRGVQRRDAGVRLQRHRHPLPR